MNVSGWLLSWLLGFLYLFRVVGHELLPFFHTHTTMLYNNNNKPNELNVRHRLFIHLRDDYHDYI